MEEVMPRYSEPKRPPYHFTIVITLYNTETLDHKIIEEKVWDRDEHFIDEIIFRLVEPYLYWGYKVIGKVVAKNYKFAPHDHTPF